jgi:putative tricarboxylic transport membrane protein
LLKTLPYKRDFYAGGLMILLGVGTVLHARNYTLGTLTHMGPGFFPLVLGVILTFLGVLIAGMAAVSGGERDRILPERKEWLGWACIIAGPLMFIFAGAHGGMAPGTFACVFVAGLGDRTATWKSALVLALGVTVFAILLFSYLLKVPLPIFRWVPL